MSRRRGDLPPPDALLASLLSLMTCFTQSRCPRRAVLVQRQLAYLQSFPDDLIAPTLKVVARRLQDDWERLLCTPPEPRAAAAPARLH